METQGNKDGSKIFLFALGVIANMLLGFITLYVSRLSTDLGNVEGVARTGAANASLLARDVENLTKWTVEEVRDLKERVRKVENEIRPFNGTRR